MTKIVSRQYSSSPKKRRPTTGLYVLSPEEELLGRPFTTKEIEAWRKSLKRPTKPQSLRTMQMALGKINRLYARELTKPQAAKAKRKAQKVIKAYFATTGKPPRYIIPPGFKPTKKPPHYITPPGFKPTKR